MDRDGVTVSTTVGDNLALFATAHTIPGGSTTFRNAVASNPVLSRAGLEAAESLFAVQMIDAAGNKVVIQPDTLITTDDPNTVNTAKELLMSTASIADNKNSGVTNVYQAKYRHIVLPYLATTNVGGRDSTKEKQWMLAAVNHTDAVLEISEMPHLISPSPGGNGEDFDNDDWMFKSAAAYGIEITDPKWIVYSLGDGS